MNFYQFDGESKKYLGSGKCQIDPIGKKPIYPKFSTPIAPPPQNALFDCYFISGQWVRKDSILGIKKKLSVKNGDGVRLYKTDGDCLILKTEEEIEIDRVNISREREKKEALDIISKLRACAYERLIEKEMTKEERDALQLANNVLRAK